MQDSQHRQDLAQDQQHLAGTEHQLTLTALLKDLIETAAVLPIPDRPDRSLRLQQFTKPRQLGVQQGLQQRPVALKS